MLLLVTFYSVGQSPTKLMDQENEYLQVFGNFKNYMMNTIEKSVDITDSAQIKHILLNYVITETSVDTIDKYHFKKGEISKENFDMFAREIRGFRQYFLEKKDRSIVQHLCALPIRLSPDKCIYDRLIPFQQQNTLIYFDDRHPEKVLGYILFIPKYKDVTPSPRILSWILQFDAGYWAFRSPMGTVGIEYFISEGVKGPEHPIGY